MQWHEPPKKVAVFSCEPQESWFLSWFPTAGARGGGGIARGGKKKGEGEGDFAAPDRFAVLLRLLERRLAVLVLPERN